MSRPAAKRCAGAVFGCLFVLAVNALGVQRDAERERDDACRIAGKTYSHQHRACVATD